MNGRLRGPRQFDYFDRACVTHRLLVTLILELSLLSSLSSPTSLIEYYDSLSSMGRKSILRPGPYVRKARSGARSESLIAERSGSSSLAQPIVIAEGAETNSLSEPAALKPITESFPTTDTPDSMSESSQPTGSEAHMIAEGPPTTETPATSTTAPSSVEPPIRSKHFYENATVQLVVEDCVYAVHKSLLKKASKYFVTIVESIEPIRMDELKARDFTAFLNVIYEPLTDLSMVPVSQLFELYVTSDYLQADAIRDSTRMVLEARGKHWGNIEDFMAGLSETPLNVSFNKLRSQCIKFLKSALGNDCVKVLLYAEMYGFDEVLSEDLKGLLPRNAYADVNFLSLSLELQNRIFFDMVDVSSKCDESAAPE
ncbi:uncharacterized protein EV422DRAFT_580874 [Fimicolochytrium jonesii]|uniref:uncharacterized protein n=1 Tax=Fimicolochytrium jonesii TaxID=1396493 RepID=UPI0022FE214C|nr:uncharacterized protein EV422DRAFT_580874 [Fimicolochytrium jonesii]KAI8817306.1 hypothetical protein EV422DRAFT_580874 [Fimicolochytrium jonesii]